MAESLAIFQTEFKRISRVIKDFVDADLAKEEIAALNTALAAKHYRDFYQEAIAAQLKSSFDFATVKKSAVVSSNETGCLASASKSETLAAGVCRKMGLIKTEGKAIEKLIADIDKDLKDRSKSSKSKPQIEKIKKDLAAIKLKYSAQKNKLGGMTALSGLMTEEKKKLAAIDAGFQKNLVKARNDAMGDLRARKMATRVINKYHGLLKKHAAEAMAAWLELEDAKKKGGNGFDPKSHKAYKDALASANAGKDIMDEYEAADTHCKADKNYIPSTTQGERDFAQQTLKKMRRFGASIRDILADLKKI